MYSKEDGQGLLMKENLNLKKTKKDIENIDIKISVSKISIIKFIWLKNTEISRKQ
jgi:hypothetical protein